MAMLSRRDDAAMYGPTTGDGVRLGDTSLVAVVEKDYAVYGDECFTRVYDGVTGKVLYSRFRTSCTWYENPVVADVAMPAEGRGLLDCDARRDSRREHLVSVLPRLAVEELRTGHADDPRRDLPGGQLVAGAEREGDL